MTFTLGKTGPALGVPFALGCMGMSGIYGSTDERECIATIHAALERGVTLLDTGDFYHHGRNELLIAKALAQKPAGAANALLSVKFGGLRAPSGQFLGFDGRPMAVQNFVGYSLARLGVDAIDIYRPARLDPHVPIEETVGAIADLVAAGSVRHIGLSEVGADTVERAVRVHPIVDLQIEYALVSRGPERKIFPVLAKHGIAVTAYGVLVRGLLTGATGQGAGDMRAHTPRFADEHRARNAAVVATFARLAADRGITPAQLAIAWARAKYPFVVPTIGARTRAQLADALAALAVKLTADDVAALETAVPADALGGERYAPAQMAHLDSER